MAFFTSRNKSGAIPGGKGCRYLKYDAVPIPAHEVFDTSASTREAQHLENQGITVFMSTFTSASDIEEHIESATVTKRDANQNPDRLVKLDQLVCWK
ncbi:unnamed protein product [Callosobruchus maculatus]|uniref:Uncharacterized protein n=1 Tax=Callosobruchus maculatus TaxID=64391 RepID=A0A653CQ25_CALMS|nr:unnamed protein product [Callosobruchus maculatus]